MAAAAAEGDFVEAQIRNPFDDADRAIGLFQNLALFDMQLHAGMNRINPALFIIFRVIAALFHRFPDRDPRRILCQKIGIVRFARDHFASHHAGAEPVAFLISIADHHQGTFEHHVVFLKRLRRFQGC